MILPLTLHWRIWRGDVQTIDNKTLIITCPVRLNAIELLNKIFTLVLLSASVVGADE